MKLRRLAGASFRLLQGTGLYGYILRRLVAEGVTIREATAADKLAVQRWLNPGSKPEYAKQQNPYVTDWVACWYGKLAGFVQLVRHPPAHAPYVGYWLFSLFVKSPLQRAGIGRKLCCLVINRAQSEGAETLDLVVFNDNDRAISLYRKLGFDIHKHMELEMLLDKEKTPDGRRRVVMRKRLAQHE